jgi:hypothetical protein
MAYQNIPGIGVIIPSWKWFSYDNLTKFAFGDIGPLRTATEKISISGKVFTKDRTSKNIQKIGFKWGSTMTVTAGGTPTAVRISLQNISGVGLAPDGTQDQYYDMVNGTDNMTADAWVETGNLSATRTVNPGEIVCVVLEFQTFNAGDVINIAGRTDSGWGVKYAQELVGLYTGTWSFALARTPNIVLCFDDGTYGTLITSTIFSATGVLTYNSGSNPDEYALVGQFPFPVRADGAWVMADFDGNNSIILTCGETTVTSGMTAANRAWSSNDITIAPFSSVVDIPANTDFYLSLRADTATNIALPYLDVNTRNYWQAIDGGINFRYTSRVDGGAWAEETLTRRIAAGLMICGFSDGAGAGGGGGLPVLGGSIVR